MLSAMSVRVDSPIPVLGFSPPTRRIRPVRRRLFESEPSADTNSFLKDELRKMQLAGEEAWNFKFGTDTRGDGPLLWHSVDAASVPSPYWPVAGEARRDMSLNTEETKRIAEAQERLAPVVPQPETPLKPSSSTQASHTLTPPLVTPPSVASTASTPTSASPSILKLGKRKRPGDLTDYYSAKKPRV